MKTLLSALAVGLIASNQPINFINNNNSNIKNKNNDSNKNNDLKFIQLDNVKGYIENYTVDNKTGNIYYEVNTAATEMMPNTYIYKYDIKTKKISLFWHLDFYEVSIPAITHMIFYNNKMYVLAINGALNILYNKNQYELIKAIGPGTVSMQLYNNNIWVSNLENLIKFNTDTWVTSYIKKPGNNNIDAMDVINDNEIYLSTGTGDYNYLYKDNKYIRLNIGNEKIISIKNMGDKIYFASIDKLFVLNEGEHSAKYLANINNSLNRQIFIFNNQASYLYSKEKTNLFSFSNNKFNMIWNNKLTFQKSFSNNNELLLSFGHLLGRSSLYLLET